MKPTCLCLTLALAAAAALAGCKSRATMFPNKTPALNRPPAVIAAEAMGRFPYPARLPRAGEASALAEVGDRLNVVTIANYGAPWRDADVWLNGTHVLHLPELASNAVVQPNFKHFFDGTGVSFPLDAKVARVERLEVVRDGALYTIPIKRS